MHWITEKITDYSSSLVHCESRVAVAAERGQFGKPEEAKRSPFEPGSRGLVKEQQAENTQCVLL
jgi:hypothetical protein